MTQIALSAKRNQKHLFWSCSKVVSFWNSSTALPKLSKIFPEHYTMNISVALGLIQDCSKNHRQINFCFLVARHSFDL